MRKRYWLSLGISAVLLFLLLKAVDVGQVAAAVSSANFVFLLPALALYFGGVALRALRWRLLLRPVKQVGFRRTFVLVVIGFMANDLLPFRAGEGVRAFMLWKKEQLEPGATLATITVERIFDGLALVSFLLVVGLAMPLEGWVTQIGAVAGVVFLAGIGGVLAMVLAPTVLERLAAGLLAPAPARLRGILLRLLRTFVDGLSVLRNPRQLLAVGALSLGAWLLEAGMYYAIMYSFPLAPSYLAALLGTAVANLGSMVPSSPGYVGTFDVPLAAVLVGTFQVDPSVAAGYTLLVHLALVAPVSLLGLLYTWREGLSLSAMAEAGARMTSGRGGLSQDVTSSTER